MFFAAQAPESSRIIGFVVHFMAKYLIKYPIVNLNMPIIKNFSVICVIKCTITKLIGNNFIAERTFLTPFITLVYYIGPEKQTFYVINCNYFLIHQFKHMSN